MQILRLKEVLKEKKVTNKNLAKQVNVTEATICNLVKGDSLPRKDLLLSISNALEIDVRELFISTKKRSPEKIFVQNQDGTFKAIGEITVKQ